MQGLRKFIYVRYGKMFNEDRKTKNYESCSLSKWFRSFPSEISILLLQKLTHVARLNSC